jgi:hypothetical protein
MRATVEARGGNGPFFGSPDLKLGRVRRGLTTVEPKH